MNPHRERSRNEVFPAPGSACYESYQLFGPQPLGPWFRDVTQNVEALKRHELMVDTTGFLQCDFNPCFHEKLEVKKFTPLTQFDRTFPDMSHESTQFHGGTGVFLVGLPEALRSLGSGLTDWIDDFGARAEHHHKTAVKDTNSLANFIIELIEMCTGNIDRLRDLIKNYWKAAEKFRKHYTETGDYWLAWNFAWKPFMNDLKSFLSIYSRAEKRLKWLCKRNRLPTKVKYREKQSFTRTVSCDVYRPGRTPGQTDLPDTLPYSITGTLECVYTVTLASHAWVRFDIPDWACQMFWLGKRYVGAIMLGFGNPLKIAWEATPFSWLLDWFVNQRDKLQVELASISPFPDAEILGSGWSMHVKCEWTGDLSITCPEAFGTMVPDGHEAARGTYECYVRQPGYPPADGSTFRVPLEWYNVSILAALLAKLTRR